MTELHVWTDRPAGWWPQGIARARPTRRRFPKVLDWDVWLGPAPQRPYNPAYVPFKWRGFWDFGTGAIGDMGIHNLDTAFWALELGTPIVGARQGMLAGARPTRRMKETAPLWSIIELRFPARGKRPPVTMTWYDGGKLPPAELFQGEPIVSKDGGSLVIGSKGTLFTRTWHGGESDADMFVLLPRKHVRGFEPPAPTLPRAAEPSPGVGRRVPRAGPAPSRRSPMPRRSPRRSWSATSPCAPAAPSSGTPPACVPQGSRRPMHSSGQRSAPGGDCRRSWLDPPESR